MPLTWFSHMLDVSLFGPEPGPAHAVNIILHSFSAAVLLLVLQRMTGHVWLAAFVAAIFAFHPLRNESVVWVSERKDVLSAMLLMFGLLAYHRYVEKPNTKRYTLVLLCLVLGLMAKPMLVTFPFLLLLLDFWPLKRMGSDWCTFRQLFCRRLLEKLPMLLIIVVACVVTYRAQYDYGAVYTAKISPTERFAQVMGNYWFYVKKISLPVGLSVIHPPETTSLLTGMLIAFDIVAVTAFVIWRAFRRPWLVVGWLWFLGTLVPVIGFVRIGHIIVAERYSYVPSVGLVMAFAWVVAALVHGRIWLGRVAAALAVVLVATCASATRTDLPRWRDSIALFESAIKTGPHPVSYNNLAAGYLDAGKYEQAIEASTRAIEMDPHNINAYINRIAACRRSGRREEIKGDLVVLVKIEPRTAEGYTMRGEALLDLERYDEAIVDFTSAIKFVRNAANLYNNRASAWLLKGDYKAAIEDCRKAIELNPGYANAYENLGNIYNRMGDLPRALENYGLAIQIAPTDPIPYNNRAVVFLALKQYDRAWADVERCRQLGGRPHEGLVQALTEAATTTK